MTGSLIIYTAILDELVSLTHDNGQVFTTKAINGTATLGPFDLPDGNGAMLAIGSNQQYRGVLWLSVKNPVNGSASFAIDTFPFRYPPVPDRQSVLGLGMHFRGGIVIDSPTYGKMPWWPSALSWLDASERQLVYTAMRVVGDTHCLIEVPCGYALYNEPGQFYDSVRFPALDWTGDLTPLSNLVDEVIQEGFLFDITMSCPVAQSQQIVQLVMNALTDEQLKYGFVVPGYDDVFYGWSNADIIKWAQLARAIKPFCYLGIQFNAGHIPLGGGPDDYKIGGPMDGYDIILGSIPSGTPTPGGTWQIIGRCVNPYIWPPDEPADADSHPPPFYLVDSPRGPRFFCAFETGYPYNWVRVDMSNQSAIDTAITTIQNEAAYFKSMGCHYIG